MTEPTYMLDGIPTAYRVVAVGLGRDASETYICQCKWAKGISAGGNPHQANNLLAALRFHYQNCRLARLPTIDPEDT